MGRKGAGGDDPRPGRNGHHLILMRHGNGQARRRRLRPRRIQHDLIGVQADTPAAIGLLDPAAKRLRHGLVAEADADQPGPADVWTRVRVPLIEGEELTGTDRVLIAADAANGISAELPIDSWLSIPPGMTAHLTREAEGDWVHLSCRTRIGGNGLGLCTGVLSDGRGVLGEVSQPLLVRAR